MLLLSLVVNNAKDYPYPGGGKTVPSAQDHNRRTKIFDDLFREFHDVPFAVRSADGWSWSSSGNNAPECTLVFKSAAAWHALMENPTERTLGEAFIDGELDVEGDLFSVFPVVHYILERPASSRYNILRTLWHGSADFARLLRHGPRHSMARDRASISYHYDLPIDFYRPWLGPTLAYSCAYFRDPSEGLESAQTNKLELICRKLGLRPKDRFLDIGCGWGSLLLHAASQYSAEAYGITLSKEQAAIAARRISHAHLEDKCKVELRDYREMPKLPTQFDKIASVGMFEHVGLKNLRDYFTIALKMLHPEGTFLNHGIARSATSPHSKDSFIDRYVFPDGELVTLSEVLQMAESVGFEVRDVDNLRTHYERTLRLWVQNLQENARTVLDYVSERTYRIWLLYMAGSADAFRIGNIELYQVLLGKRPGSAQEKLATRENWYQSWTTAASKATVS
ncbi:MAG: cyclopropane-fatty-acyl-phospholipid synthase family protein [Acidobacteriaceae bacterium]